MLTATGDQTWDRAFCGMIALGNTHPVIGLLVVQFVAYGVPTPVDELIEAGFTIPAV
jgi:hypothetical protein